MILISSVKFPYASSKQMVKNMTALSPIKDLITISGPYFMPSVETGVSITTIYEFPSEKYKEAVIHIHRRFATFATFANVPGFSYSLNEWLEIDDALKMTGLLS